MKELLKVAKPDLVREWDAERNAGIPLDTIRVNASIKVGWICHTNSKHRWEARVRNRAVDGNGCPFCSGRNAIREESFGLMYPAIAREINPHRNPGFDEFTVGPGSNRLIWWICANGHEWRTDIARRVRDKSGCRKCAYLKGRPTLDGSPLAREFHSTKNGTRTARSLTLGSRERVWWQCEAVASHEWQEAINYRVKSGNRCPKCYPRGTGRLQTLDMFSASLCQEWHPTLNRLHSPKDLTVGSSMKIWWRCVRNPAHPAWKALVRNRTINKQGCPRCAPRGFDENRTIAALFRNLVPEWHPTKNEPWTPSNVTIGSSRIVWWRCAKDPTHEWQRMVNVRTKGNSPCPHCSGLMVYPERSLSACFPKIADEWHPKKNGVQTPETVKAKSGKKVYWQCAINPAHEWRAQIKNRTINGSGCPACARENNVLRIQQELNKSAFNTTEVYRTFLFSIRNLESLSKAPPSKPALRTLFFRMLYAQVITALEAYLSDAFLKLVVSNPTYKKRLVSDAAGFRDKKFTLAEILELNPISDDAIAASLSEFSWHHITRVKTLFSVVCGVEFSGDLFPLLKAVTNRHDIVHRNGKSIKGRGVAVGAKEVFDLFSTVKDFVRELEGKLSLIEAKRVVVEVRSADREIGSGRGSGR